MQSVASIYERIAKVAGESAPERLAVQIAANTNLSMTVARKIIKRLPVSVTSAQKIVDWVKGSSTDVLLLTRGENEK